MSEQVLIQGEEYSFHDQAAALLGVPKELRESAKTHRILYDELQSRANGRAVVAFINTTKGRIGGSYEHIAAGNLMTIGRVVGRADLTIRLPLYGVPGSRLEDIRFIHTQTHAMDQCIQTVSTEYAQTRWVSETDTASSARTVWDLHDPRHAAITPGPAGEAAGLERLVETMQDSAHNVTSFYMLGKGEHSIVPEDATITVAALERVGDGNTSHGLRTELDHGMISLLHESDVLAERLIIEIDSGGDHVAAIESARMAMQGLYSVTYLGGYKPMEPQVA